MTRVSTIPSMPAVANEREVLRLLTWLSPAFPIGSFSFSHGIEQAVERGLVHDAESLRCWIAAILAHGAGWIDGILLTQCWRAERAGDDSRLAALAELADCQRATAELALESQAQGKAFLTAVRAAWPHARLEHYLDLLARIARPPAHACAVGVATAIAGIPEAVTVPAFLQAFAANLVSAGVRLIPLGQSDGLRVLAALETMLPVTALAARAATMADLGTATWMADWTSASHETQYTRLFRS